MLVIVMLSKPKVPFPRTLTDLVLRSVVPVTSLLIPPAPVLGLIPGYSPFEVKSPNGYPHPPISTCPVERELKLSPVQGDANRMQVQVEIPATVDRLNSPEIKTIPTQSFTLTLQRQPKSNQVVLSTSQGYSVALTSQAPLSTAQIWLADLDRTHPNAPQIPEVILTLPERTHPANTPVGYSVIVLKDMPPRYSSKPNRSWRFYPLKTVTTDPKQDFFHVKNYFDQYSSPNCGLLTAESLKLPKRGAYWNYRMTFFEDNHYDEVDWKLLSLPYPMLLPQSGTDAQRKKALVGKWGDLMMGRYMGQNPQAIATFHSLQAGSRLGEAQVTVKDSKGKLLRLVPKEVLYVCTNSPTHKQGHYLPYFLDTERLEALKSFLYEHRPKKQVIKIYGILPLPDGRASADLFLIEEPDCQVSSPFPS